jgi:hypothetical protein
VKTLLKFIAPPADVTANGTGPVFDLSAFDDHHAVITLSTTAPTGTTPSYTLSLQSSDSESGPWVTTEYAFEAVTNEASEQQVEVDLDSLGQYLQAVDTITGTTPGVLRAVALAAQPKYG